MNILSPPLLKRKGLSFPVLLFTSIALFCFSYVFVNVAEASDLTIELQETQDGGIVAPFNTVGQTLNSGQALCPANPASGCDFNGSDDVVRTNDQVAYKITLRSESGSAPNSTFTIELQEGMYWDTSNFSAFCSGPGSSLTGDGSPGNPSILVCNVGSIGANASQTYPFNAVVRGDNPNGTMSGVTSASYDADGNNATAPVEPAELPSDLTITAAPRWNLRKSFYSYYNVTKDGVPGILLRYRFFIEHWDDGGGSGGGAVGSEMLDGTPINIIDSLTDNNATNGTGVNPSAELYECLQTWTILPRPLLSASASTPEESVIDGGTLSCAQSAIGQPITMTITGMDSSLNHWPTENDNGGAISSDRYLASAWRMGIWIPSTEITNTPDNELGLTNTASGFDPISISEQSNWPEDDGADGLEYLDDNEVAYNLVGGSGSWSKIYTGEAGKHHYQDRPGTTTGNWSGEGLVAPNEGFASRNVFTAKGVLPASGVKMCDVIDTGTYQMVDAGNGTPSIVTNTAGVMYRIEYATTYATAWPPSPTVSSGAQLIQECDDAVSTWYTDTLSIPGGINAIVKARLIVEGDMQPGNYVYWWLAHQADPNNTLPLGTILPNYATVRSDNWYTDWRNCTYRPQESLNVAHLGAGCGDRVTLMRAVARVLKEVNVTSTLAGGTANYTLRPSYTSEGIDLTDTVIISDVLPIGLAYVNGSASPAPTTVSGSISTGMVLSWNLGVRTTNVPLPVITYQARTDINTTTGTIYQNTAVINAPNTDISPEDLRSASALLRVANPEGLKIAKFVWTPEVEITEQISYTVFYGNNSGETAPLTGIDLIDIFPYNGDDDGIDFDGRTPPTDFEGSLTLVNYSSSQAGDIILFKSVADPDTLVQNPSDSSNLPADATSGWCTVAEINAPTAGCPTSVVDADAMRVLGEPFPKGDPERWFNLIFDTAGNREGDLYTNSAGIDSDQLLPVNSQDVTARIVESTIGDRVWYDFSADGNQDANEPGMPGVTIELLDSNGTVISTTVTTTDGKYLFQNLHSGDYTVRVDAATLPAGYAQTYDLTGGLDHSADYTLGYDEEARTVDFGYAGSGSIGDTIYWDLDGDGVEDSGEGGIAGVIISLTLPSGHVITTTTDTNGEYIFPNLPPGDYTVTVDPNTLPSNIQQTGDPDGGNNNTSSLTLGDGENNLEQDFGYEPFMPDIELEKTVYAGHDAGVSCQGIEWQNGFNGDPVTYCFLVTNTGNTYLNDIKIVDSILGVTLTIAGNIAPDGTGTAYYESSVDGDLVNEATASGNPTDADGNDLPTLEDPTDDDTATVTEDVIPPVASIDLEKTVYQGHDNGASCVGSELVENFDGTKITYCFEISNLGNTWLEGVTVIDSDLGITLTVPGLISPTETVVLHYQTTISGTLVNSADTTGNPVEEDGTDIPDIDEPTDHDIAVVIPPPALPAITIEKTVYEGHNSGASCQGGELETDLFGTPVTYCFVVTNTGNTYLDNVVITDSDLGITITVPSIMAPNAVVSAYAESSITGSLVNSADVTGNPTNELGEDIPKATDPTDTDTAAVSELPPVPGIEIEKTVYGGHDSSASCAGTDVYIGTDGEEVTYCFAVKNTGNTYLDGVTVTDNDLGIVLNVTGIMSPGQSVMLSSESVISGTLVNSAETTGNPTSVDGTDIPGLTDPTDEDIATVSDQPIVPSISLEKTVYEGHDNGAGCEGIEQVQNILNTSVTYCFLVTNTGTTYLDDIELIDATLNVTLTVPGPMAPNDSAMLYVTSTIQSSLVNSATVTANPEDDKGTDLSGLDDVTDTNTASVVEVEPVASIELKKTVYLGHDLGANCGNGVEQVISASGDPITFCFEVTNTGNTYLTDVLVVDNDLNITLTVPGPMAPNAVETVYYDSNINGILVNTAGVDGNPAYEDGSDIPKLPNVTDEDTASIGDEEPVPAIDLEKTVYEGHDGGVSCPGVELVTDYTGEAVTYCFEITNAGNTYLADIELADVTLGITLTHAGPLSPTETIYLYHQAIITGTLENLARATANPVDADGDDLPGLENPVDENTATVNAIPPIPSITLMKSVYLGHNAGASCAGSELENGFINTKVTYCFEVFNTGNTYLSDIVVADPALGITLTVTGPLTPSESIMLHHETIIDGSLVNTANATGSPTDEDGNDVPNVDDPTDDDSAEVIEDPYFPGIDLEKTVYEGHDGGFSCEGGELVTNFPNTEVTFCFLVTNTGNSYLDDFVLVDAALGITLTATGPIAPNGTMMMHYETAIDGDVVNVASVSANPVDAEGNDIVGATDPEANDTAEVDEVPYVPGINLEKTVYLGHTMGTECAGSEFTSGYPDTRVTYCFEVTNTGNTYLEDIVVNDVTLGISLTLAGPIAPSQTITLHHEAVIDGTITNSAEATANPTTEGGDDITDVDDPTSEDTADVAEIPYAPGITVEKTVYEGHDGGNSCPSGEIAAGYNGSFVTFCFEVTNTGDTYLNDVVVTDALLGITLVHPGILAPDETIMLYAESKIDGIIVNNAAVTGTPTTPSGEELEEVEPPVDDNTAELTELPWAPGISLEKTVYDGHDNGAQCPGTELTSGNNGHTVTYCFEVQNTGDTYLTDVIVNDMTLGITVTHTGILAPNETVMLHIETTINGSIENTALVNATPSDATGVPLEDVSGPTDYDTAAVTDIPWAPGINLEKTVYDGHDNGAQCPGTELTSGNNGHAVTYCFEVQNTGDTYLTDVIVNDMTLGITATHTGILAPNETVMLHIETTINGSIENTALVNATPSDATGVPLEDVPGPTDNDTAEVTDIPWVPGINLEKTVYAGHNNGISCAGSNLANGYNGAPVTFCFEVTNTGDTYLNDVVVNDVTLGIIITHSGILAPDQTIMLFVEADIDGTVENTANASGTPTDAAGNTLDNTTPPADSDTAIVFENEGDSSIGDSIWIDADNDGVQDPGEAPMEGVTVILTMPDGSTLTTTTDANGQYLFDGLNAGSYTITVIPPAGTMPTYDPDSGTGGSDTCGCDNAHAIDLGSDESYLDADFGFMEFGSIGDTIWLDDNDNGLFDGADGPLEGVVVILTMPDGSTISTTTGADGTYLFDGLLPGDYSIEVVAPFVAPTQSFDPDSGPGGSGSCVCDGSHSVTLAPGEEYLTGDFGFTAGTTSVSLRGVDSEIASSSRFWVVGMVLLTVLTAVWYMADSKVGRSAE